MDERESIESDALLSFIDDLRKPALDMVNSRNSDVFVILSFPIDSYSEADVKKLLMVERLLRELGVVFDTGIGLGQRDWFLDEKLTGAWLKEVK